MLLPIGRSILFLIVASGLIAGHPLIALPTARAQGDEPTTVRVSASDHEFELDGTIIPAGRVRFEVVNISDTTRHEVWVYPIDQRNSPRFDEMLYLKRTGERANERDFVDDILGNSGEIEAGHMATFEAVLPPGLYELGCFARDGDGDDRLVHYEHGMFAALVVIASE
jgi:hypothetical protein